MANVKEFNAPALWKNMIGSLDGRGTRPRSIKVGFCQNFQSPYSAFQGHLWDWHGFTIQMGMLVFSPAMQGSVAWVYIRTLLESLVWFLRTHC